MDDTRYERLEARISALEAEVRLITAESVRAQSPPSPTVTEPAVVREPADARHVAGAPNVSASSGKTPVPGENAGGPRTSVRGPFAHPVRCRFFSRPCRDARLDRTD
jgi:hypothetical protein